MSYPSGKNDTFASSSHSRETPMDDTYWVSKGSSDYPWTHRCDDFAGNWYQDTLISQPQVSLIPYQPHQPWGRISSLATQAPQPGSSPNGNQGAATRSGKVAAGRQKRTPFRHTVPSAGNTLPPLATLTTGFFSVTLAQGKRLKMAQLSIETEDWQ